MLQLVWLQVAVVFLMSGGTVSAQERCVSASVRMAPPGVWTAGLGIGGRCSRDGGGSCWWTSARVSGPGGAAELSACVAARLDSDRRAGLGLEWRGPGAASMVFGASQGHMGAWCAVPLLQPAALRFRPAWGWSWTGRMEDRGDGLVLVEWSGGRLPAVQLVFRHAQWECGAGSRGLWYARGNAGRASGIRWVVGLLRGDIPWLGLDWGRSPVGSDVRGAAFHLLSGNPRP